LISIILPVYNRQEYIERAIDSVLRQSYEQWELIAVDDGSTDLSASLIEKYKQQTPQIKIIYQYHQNLPSAKNKGIQHARGNIITFLDSDDEFKKDHLKFRVEYLNQNPKIEFIYGGVKIIGNEYVPDKYDLTKLVHLSACTIGATFFGKKEVFEKLGGFRQLPYSEDSEFLERVINHYKVSKVNFPTYVYHREVPDSITQMVR
jgi:glycosyltransferase involved in cell wall biosynthesis